MAQAGFGAPSGSPFEARGFFFFFCSVVLSRAQIGTARLPGAAAGGDVPLAAPVAGAGAGAGAEADAGAGAAPCGGGRARGRVHEMASPAPAGGDPRRPAAVQKWVEPVYKQEDKPMDW